MSLREKERAKEQQDKFQAILSALLKDEDNKYCVDCDAKGPRWASWNLGIFLCIRCAGIHRNLGVHISRVKSVNLDTWTAEQVAMMQEIGNSRGRAVYEANIPDGFRRPQSKYEQKKYIAREWVPPTPKIPKEWLEDSKSDKKKARSKPASGQIQLGGMVPKAPGKPTSVVASSGDSNARPTQPAKTEVKLPQVKPQEPAAPSSAANDLLGLEAIAPAAQSSGNELLDLFGGPQPGTTASAVAPSANNDLMNGTSSEANLFEQEGSGEEKKTSTKDSIMALFGGTGGGGGGAPPQQMYNIPGGMYMPQGQQGFGGMMVQPQNMMGQSQNMMGQPQNMMGYQPNMMGQQPQGMMGNPAVNGSQMGMYNNQMMSGAQGGMYTPQQMQQFQFQQMQQQMAAMNMGGPQPMQGGWGGNSTAGQTLSNNLWQ
ncbi:stromal membrane-associated protein 1 [Elysia marginata]|uniref:Stromal membrane-associated protein 1 n=1 Tax=Elysia marginata TaxID=1093978 RepID=A0AAV4HDN9_9GAST|nr:stromal membrane-associated protein 1 [Elysia marginata]